MASGRDRARCTGSSAMKNYKGKHPYSLISLLLAIVLVVVLINVAVASEDDDRCRYDCEQEQEDPMGNVDADAAASASADAASSSNSSSFSSTNSNSNSSAEGGDAFAEGGDAVATGGDGGEGGGGGASDASATINYAKRAPTNFLYMQNQVEACGRTFGFSGSNTSGGWAFGIPIPRSWTPTCDLWKAASFAKESGFIATSYTFQCSIKTIRKVLGNERCVHFEEQSLIELGIVAEAPDLGGLYNRNAQVGWLVAEVTEEEYIAQQEVIEYRLEQAEATLIEREQLIEEHAKETAEHDAELKKLKAIEAQRQKKEAARRAAARAALEKET